MLRERFHHRWSRPEHGDTNSDIVNGGTTSSRKRKADDTRAYTPSRMPAVAESAFACMAHQGDRAWAVSMCRRAFALCGDDKPFDIEVSEDSDTFHADVEFRWSGGVTIARSALRDEIWKKATENAPGWERVIECDISVDDDHHHGSNAAASKRTCMTIRLLVTGDHDRNVVLSMVKGMRSKKRRR